MSKIDLSIIIPAYNEGPEFDGRMKKLADYLAKHDYGTTEVLLMMQSNDTSGDVEEAMAFVQKHPNFRVVNLGKRAGKGGAVKAGMLEAKGRYRLFMDADLATPLRHLDDVKELMERKADVGIAIRNLVSTHDSFIRKFITKFGNILAQVILLPGIDDTQCGFKVFSAEAAEEVFNRQTINGWGFDLEILAVARKLGYHIDTFKADDWKDPKVAGLVGDSPIKAALQVFRDLLSVRWGLMIGRYNKKRSAAGDKRLEEHLANITDGIVLTTSLVVGAILRFMHIGKASIWHDEGYTMMLAPQAVGDILVRTARDVHPPLYYIKLHYWMEVFGQSELAARSLSVVFMLGVIVVGFLLARELFGHKVARLAAVLLAIAPFLVRYSQEARMYAMVAFLVTLSAYWLIKALRTNKIWFWLGYTVLIPAAILTHYYAVFAVALFWIVALVFRGPKPGIFNPRWWISNVASFLLLAAWLPAAYAQFSRVQGGFWIPKPTIYTLPSNLGQFVTMTDLGVVPGWIRIIGTLVFLGITIAFVLRKKLLPGNVLFAGLAFLAPFAVLALSLKRPIYIDRYFVYAGVGFFLMIAAWMYTMPPWQNRRIVRWLTIFLLVVTCGVGVRNVYAQSTHTMALVGDYVNANYKPGDIIISGELYTYFDYSYYNKTGTVTKWYSPGGMNGYGETSLLYDRQDEVLVTNYDDIQPDSGTVWIIGKPNKEEDFAVPASWLMLDEFTTNSSTVRHYQINATQ